MKKFVSLFLALILIVSLAACSSAPAPKPEDTVKGFMDAAKGLDFEKMTTFINPTNKGSLTSISDGIKADSAEKCFMDYLKTQSSKMTYEIKSSDVSGNTATVSVNCKYIDGTPFFKAVIEKFFTAAFEAAFAGKELTDEMTNEMIKKIVTEQQKAITDTFKESTVKIKCVKADGKWVLDTVDNDLGNIVTSNLMSASEEIEKSFGETSED